MPKLKRKAYNSIDNLPIFNWNKVRDGELGYLYESENEGKISKKEILKLRDLWEVLFNDYFVRFGKNDYFKEYLSKRVSIAKMQVDCILNNKPSLSTFIEIAQLELDEMRSEPPDFMSTIVTLEKHLGFSIDVYTCSVTKYHAYLNNINGKG